MSQGAQDMTVPAMPGHGAQELLTGSSRSKGDEGDQKYQGG